MLRSIVALLSLLLLTASARAWQPAEAVKSAWDDLQRVPQVDRRYTRYMALMPDDVKMTQLTSRIISGHVNFLSTRRRIVAAGLIMEDGTTVGLAGWSKAD